MKKCVISLMLVLTILSVPLTASAQPVLDLTRRGSITITMRYQNKPVSGGSLNAYQVGSVQEDNGNYSFVPVKALQDRISKFWDIQSPALAGTLAKYAALKKLPPVTAKPAAIGKNGTAVFSNLEPGLYLVVYDSPDHKKCEPFLVSLPYLEDGAYRYDVDASPKVRFVPPTGGGGGGKLPQTGQLWWPVPVLVCAGLGSVVVGLIRRREGEDEP